MSDADSRGKLPQDLVAIFHASFHPTRGNIIDWTLKASDDLSLDRLEFNALPSGLHLVEKDVIYFSKDGQRGVCVFRRRKTTEQGHRGFRLSSLGVLLAKSRRPRPSLHVDSLKELIDSIYSRWENSGILEPTENDWELARIYFEERKLKRSDLGGAGEWNGWEDELDGAFSGPNGLSPTLHLPHLLQILGPSSLTLYKHVLGRKRVLIYTLPPVEVSCLLCQIAADFCFETQTDVTTKGKHKEPINVLGMVTLIDLDRLTAESETGRGWIACTTDAIFMEKPSFYDLLIDLTTLASNKSTRATFYASKSVPQIPGSLKAPSSRLSTIRFAWSDIKLWNEIERILHLHPNGSIHANCCNPSSDAPIKATSITAWTDAWQVYEDVCIICAGLWIGSWRGNSTMSYSTANGPENWGAVRLEGDDDLTSNGAYVRNVGMGIEGRPVAEGSSLGPPSSAKVARRASAISWSSGKGTVVGPGGSSISRQPSSATPMSPANENFGLAELVDAEEESQRRRNSQLLTTLAILQTFHAHALFQLSVMEDILKHQGVSVSSDSGGSEKIVYLTPKDILAFELGPLSGFDSKYLEWLGQEYAGDNVKVVVKRSWRDLLAALFGY